MTGPAWHVTALLLALAASACASIQPAPPGAPGGVVVRMGGSFTGFGGAGSR